MVKSNLDINKVYYFLVSASLVERANFYGGLHNYFQLSDAAMLLKVPLTFLNNKRTCATSAWFLLNRIRNESNFASPLTIHCMCYWTSFMSLNTGISQKLLLSSTTHAVVGLHLIRSKHKANTWDDELFLSLFRVS